MVVQEPQNILAWEPESAAALRHFESTAWCGKLLRQPGLRLFRVQYDRRKPRGWDPVVHGLLAEPAATGEGVRHFLSGMLVPATAAPALDRAGAAGPEPLYGGGARRPHNPFPQHVSFYALGPGLAGHSRTVHGGVIALLVDSAFAQLGFVHGRPGTRFYSAYTNTRFARPVLLPYVAADGEDRRMEDVPGVDVVVRAQVDSRRTREGDRKIFVLARVEGEDGVVYATGEGLLIEKVLAGTEKL